MDNEHIVKAYDDELDQLDKLIAEMGGLCEVQLSQAVEAMVKGDVELASRVIDNDKIIDDMEHQVDSQAINLIALRQPMAEDLRMIIAALKVATNLERVGDYAKNIAKRTITLSQSAHERSSATTIARMSGLVQNMIKNVLDAYLARDAELAEDIRQRDQEVDQIHSSLFRELLTYMMEDPRNITPCTHQLFIAKNIERIGDHITGVAEQIIFVVRGEAPSDDRPKDDHTSFTVVKPGTNQS